MSLSLQIGIIQLLVPCTILLLMNVRTPLKYRKMCYIILSVIAITIYSLIEGNRYDVGLDWQQYKDTYEIIRRNGFLGEQADRLEFGYILFNKIIAYFDFDFTFFFFLESVIYIAAVVYVFIESPKCTWIALCIYICMFRTLHENISRQFLAHSILYVGVYSYYNGKKIYGICISLLSGLFHFSAYPIVIFYFIVSRIDVKRIKLGFILLLFVTILILYETVLKAIMDTYLPLISLFTDRDLYSDIGEDSRFFRDYDIPASRILVQSFFVCILLVSGYKYIQQKGIDKYKTFLYAISSLGLILWIPFQQYELLSRYNIYFTSFIPIMYAYMLKEYKCKPVSKCLIFLFLIYQVYCYLGTCAGMKWKFV